MKREWQERLFRYRPVRFGIGVFFLLRGVFFRIAGKRYRSLNDICWVARVSDIGFLERIAEGMVFAAIRRVSCSGSNDLVDSYLRDPASRSCASIYSLSGPGTSDIFRDLIVLKKATSAEKGVVLLKYARTFSAVVALFDLRRLMMRYTFVLEPCWAGYCDPSILMFISSGNPVIVQCFTEEDFGFISRVGYPLVPVKLGPADWVNSDIFRGGGGVPKVYDLVMVANWAAHKRHSRLFEALASIPDRRIRVLLVGFPWGDRTAADIRREAQKFDKGNVEVTILEKVPQMELAEYVNQCKVFVFLSRKEGDNKALVEAMFAGLPAIVYDKSIGGAVSRINGATGVLASDEGLAEKVSFMLDNYGRFAPRQWALGHTGSQVATRILDQAVGDAVRKNGGEYSGGIVEKTNSPNLAYKRAGSADEFKDDYSFILDCLRDSFRSAGKPGTSSGSR